MGPGLPGIGIAGIFYLTLALLAPVRELWLTSRGRSSAERWKRVWVQFGIAVSVLASIFAFYRWLWWAARRGWLGSWGERGIHFFNLPNIAVAWLILAAVLLAMMMYGVRVATRYAQPHPSEIAEAHRTNAIPEPLLVGDAARARGIEILDVSDIRIRDVAKVSATR